MFIKKKRKERHKPKPEKHHDTCGFLLDLPSELMERNTENESKRSKEPNFCLRNLSKQTHSDQNLVHLFW